ncbi:MAG: sialidase family protein [Bacteroidales bacterium]
MTKQVHRPNQPSVNPAYNFKDDWRSYANTPGHAMQYTSGKYKGRIVVAANHSQGNPSQQFEDYFSHVFYTDDHGKTFKLGEKQSICREVMKQLLQNYRAMVWMLNARVTRKAILKHG